MRAAASGMVVARRHVMRPSVSWYRYTRSYCARLPSQAAVTSTPIARIAATAASFSWPPPATAAAVFPRTRQSARGREGTRRRRRRLVVVAALLALAAVLADAVAGHVHVVVVFAVAVTLTMPRPRRCRRQVGRGEGHGGGLAWRCRRLVLVAGLLALAGHVHVDVVFADDAVAHDVHALALAWRVTTRHACKTTPCSPDIGGIAAVAAVARLNWCN